MYCPYCGAQLTPTSYGELRCSETGALFSQRIRWRFEQLTTDATDLGSDTENSSCRLHCPKCGSKTGHARCLTCGATLTTGMVQEIIELNPHLG